MDGWTDRWVYGGGREGEREGVTANGCTKCLLYLESDMPKV